MDKYDMEIQAAVNLPSRQTINKQILDLEKKINKLKISGTLDDAAIKKLTDQLKSLKATVTTIDFSPSALQNLTSQVEKALSSVNVSDAGTKRQTAFWQVSESRSPQKSLIMLRTSVNTVSAYGFHKLFLF